MPTDATPPGGAVRGGTTTAPAPADTSELEAGLDALQTEKATATRARWRGRAVLGPLLAVGVFLVIWQVVVWLDLKPTYVLPGPADVARAFGLMWQRGDVQVAILTSLERGLIGFVVAVLIGTQLGFVVARVAWVRTAFGPIITGLQVLPSVAWVPAAIIWFGLSDATVYFVILMGAVPSVINGLVAGVDHVPPLFLGVGRVLGAGPIQMVRWVILPAALPAYLAGLRQGWAFSWRSLMAA